MGLRGRHRTIAAGLGACVMAVALVCLVPALFEWDARRQAFDPAQRLAAREASPLYRDAAGALLHGRLATDDHWRMPVSLDAVHPYAIQATLAAEDRRFYEHRGVDWLAVLRAVWLNVSEGEVRSGASTLSMQLVKLAAPRPRSLSGKLAQASDAIALETHWSKDRILETYLNSAPYGGNIAGIEAASRRYFGKPASQLGLSEAALLAGLPQSPTRLNPLKHPGRAQARRDHVLRLMHEADYIDAATLDRALNSPLGLMPENGIPQQAPHLLARLANDRPEGGTLHLDARLQRRIEKLLPDYLKRFDNEVRNAAVLVLRVEDRAVLAHVGGADFFGSQPGAQVDMIRARRSPGSTLKPFVYGAALEQQQVYPTEFLLDDTLDYGSYAPANFDGDFNGLVSASEALRYSLNVPAVLLQERIGTASLLATLRDFGFASLDKSAEAYGLGLSLGNGAIRPTELATAYAALADGGRVKPLRYWVDTPEDAARTILSPGTAALIWDMLEQAFPWEHGGDRIRPRGGAKEPVAWKTGTSTGQHDAWSVAYNRHYVVVVWVGNSDGRPSRRLVGAEAALPLAGRIFRSLPPLDGAAHPENVTRRPATLCAHTGLPANRHCPAQKTVRFPESLLLHRACRVHGLGSDGALAARWPGLARDWDCAAVPAIATTREKVTASQLAILSPPAGSAFLHTADEKGNRITLRANRNHDPELHWYLNGKYLGKSTPEQAIDLELHPGEHRISVMNPAGVTATHQFRVESLAHRP